MPQMIQACMFYPPLTLPPQPIRARHPTHQVSRGTKSTKRQQLACSHQRLSHTASGISLQLAQAA